MTITINPKNKIELEKIKVFLKTNEVKFVVENSENDLWNELPDAQKHSIGKGLKDFVQRNVISHEEVMKSFGR